MFLKMRTTLAERSKCLSKERESVNLQKRKAREEHTGRLPQTPMETFVAPDAGDTERCMLIMQSLLGSKEARNDVKLFTIVTFFIMQSGDALQESPPELQREAAARGTQKPRIVLYWQKLQDSTSSGRKIISLFCRPPVSLSLAMYIENLSVERRGETRSQSSAFSIPSRDPLRLTSDFIRRPLPSQREHVYSIIHTAVTPSYFLFFLQQEPFNDYSQKMGNRLLVFKDFPALAL